VHITGVEETCAPEDAGRFAYTQLDVTDTGAVRAFAAALPRVDILVNCAAITAGARKWRRNSSPTCSTST
jgi:NAD(P)-dependent dehydrogenase (short-subunit alcohol dehydrogenase family)